MGVILFVRHGQASFGHADYDRLSEQGERQARALGESLTARGVRPARIVSGGLLRQRQTADILSDVLGVGPVSIDPRWDEYDHNAVVRFLGVAGRTQEQLAADLAEAPDPARAFQAILDDALERWVASDGADEQQAGRGVRSFPAYQERVQAALGALTALSGVTVAVSSAGTISAAIAPLLGIPAAAWPRLQRVMVNTSVTKVVSGRSGVSLLSFNAHDHLEGLADLAVTYR